MHWLRWTDRDQARKLSGSPVAFPQTSYASGTAALNIHADIFCTLHSSSRVVLFFTLCVLMPGCGGHEPVPVTTPTAVVGPQPQADTVSVVTEPAAEPSEADSFSALELRSPETNTGEKEAPQQPEPAVVEPAKAVGSVRLRLPDDRPDINRARLAAAGISV